jgi:hypothetical protein
MAHGTVVLAGSLPVEHLALDLLVAEFGWSFKEADSLRCLAELNVDHNLVTVLFSRRIWRFPATTLCAPSWTEPRERFPSSAMGRKWQTPWPFIHSYCPLMCVKSGRV